MCWCQDVVDLALVVFTHCHRDPPGPPGRDHRLSGSLRARAAADEAFPVRGDGTEGEGSPSRRRSPRRGALGSPGSPTFSASGTVLSSVPPTTRTASRVEFLLRHLTELLHIVAATQPAVQQGATELPRVLFGRLSAVIFPHVINYTAPTAFWPPSAPPVLPGEPLPSVSVELAADWLAAGLRAARAALSQAAAGAEEPTAFSLATGEEQGPRGDATALKAVVASASLELWGHKTTTVRAAAFPPSSVFCALIDAVCSGHVSHIRKR